MRKPNIERENAILKYVQDGKSYREIAPIFNITHTGVMKAFRRAQKRVVNLSTDRGIALKNVRA